MRAFFVAALAASFAALCFAEVTRYDGYVVVKAQVSNPDQAAAIQKRDFDVWSNDGVVVVGDNDIMLMESGLDFLRSLHVTYKIKIGNVQHAIDMERTFHENARKNSSLGFYEAYSTYDVIADYVATLADQYPTISTYIPSIGVTVQGKDIGAITFTGSNSNGNATKRQAKRQIFLQGGQHAREWIAPVTVVYIIEQFLAGYGVDAEITAILDKVVFHVVWQINLDGYQFSWTNTRLWRKNRQIPPSGSTYYGVDLNRNWDDHWGGQGSSRQPSSDTYCGTGPFSEPETTAVSNYVLKSGPFDAMIDFHSYSQLVLRPEGWTTTPPPNEAVSKAVGDEIRDQIYSVHGVPYTSQPSWALYFTTGSVVDWTYNTAKILLSYCIELRDTGTYGFVLPPAQILPTGQENFQAMKFLGQYVAEI